jgi:hypothetical protein
MGASLPHQGATMVCAVADWGRDDGIDLDHIPVIRISGSNAFCLYASGMFDE